MDKIILNLNKEPEVGDVLVNNEKVVAKKKFQDTILYFTPKSVFEEMIKSNLIRKEEL